MIKYTAVELTFAEIPDEINLCFSISNCAGMCQGCHSPELRTNIGKSLKDNIISELEKQPWVTCVVFLGEALKIPNVYEEWREIVDLVRQYRPDLKIAMYSGRDAVEIDVWPLFDYVKIGSYYEEFGPLNNRKTNQKLYKNDRKFDLKNDITNMFWRMNQ